MKKHFYHFKETSQAIIHAVISKMLIAKIIHTLLQAKKNY